MLIGGIVALGFNLTRSVEAVQQQAQVNGPVATAPDAAPPSVSMPIQADALGASTLKGLQQASISQSTAWAVPDQVTRRVGGLTADF